MRRFALENAWWVTFLIALILLICNTFSFITVKVDTTSLLLLAILLISPFAQSLKKIKFGEFEAEIDPKEVQKVKEEADASLPESPKEEKIRPPEIIQAIEGIRSLVKNDPVVALAKLRIEIEKSIIRLHKMTVNRELKTTNYSLIMMVRELTLQEVLPRDTSLPLQRVIQLCNRAIHGQDIRYQDAETVVNVGVDVLVRISSVIQGFIVKPQEIIDITQSDLERYQMAKYRVTTIVPYADDPVKKVRYLSQDGLNELLQGYGEYAEFVIDITLIE